MLSSPSEDSQSTFFIIKALINPASKEKHWTEFNPVFPKVLWVDFSPPQTPRSMELWKPHLTRVPLHILWEMQRKSTVCSTSQSRPTFWLFVSPLPAKLGAHSNPITPCPSAPLASTGLVPPSPFSPLPQSSWCPKSYPLSILAHILSQRLSSQA